MGDQATAPVDEQPTRVDDTPPRRVVGKASATMPDLTAGDADTAQEDSDG